MSHYLLQRGNSLTPHEENPEDIEEGEAVYQCQVGKDERVDDVMPLGLVRLHDGMQGKDDDQLELDNRVKRDQSWRIGVRGQSEKTIEEVETGKETTVVFEAALERVVR